MNIFPTSNCAIESAINLCDKHIPKLVVEDFQMLSCAVIRYNAPLEKLPLTKSGNSAKGGYHKHPCSIWAGNTRSNFNWLCDHAKETCKEYTFRFGKIHFCEKGIYQLSSLNYLIPEGPLQPFAIAINESKGPLQPFAIAINESMTCRQLPNFDLMSPVEKYRSYIKMDKSFAKWEKGREKPNWY